jgi:urease accessory protein
MSVIEFMLADSRTPTGGFAHSGGLESAVEAGLSLPEVPGFVRSRMRTVGFVDAALAAVSASVETIDSLVELDQAWAARTPAPPLRLAARQLGVALLRVARVWWPWEELLSGYANQSELTPRPVVLGAVGRLAGLSPLAVARLSLYEDAAGVIASASKLLVVDTATTSGWLALLAAELEALAERAALEGLDASTCTPLLDRRALEHSVRKGKLFVT